MFYEMIRYSVFFCIFLILCSCKDDDPSGSSNALQLSSVHVGTFNIILTDGAQNLDAPFDKPILLSFAAPLNTETVLSSITLLTQSGDAVNVTYSFLDNNKTVSLQPVTNLDYNSTYLISITNKLKGASGENFPGISINFTTGQGILEIVSWAVNGNIVSDGKVTDAPLNTSIQVNFSMPLDPQTLSSSTVRILGKNPGTTQITLNNQNNELTISSSNTLDHFNRYMLIISGSVKGSKGEAFTEWSRYFFTAFDLTPKYPVVSDDALLTIVQQQTFKYFWDFAHENSGMARERNTSGNLVTSGGSGFGIMALVVGMERGFITRQQGLERIDKILDFLETADRFHGAWPHWMDGNTGDVIAFSANDNGGDLVETSFLVQGLLTFRQYLNASDVTEQGLIDRINTLYNSVEWDWYTRGGEDVLYWHWSPDKDWIMNMPIRGYNEALITYVLAASSSVYGIDPSVYHNGWAQGGAIINGRSFYGITLPLGYNYGGPLFFTHYSFLGLDPRNLSDTYAGYWEQNVNHTLINYQHSVENPYDFVGYSENNWGLTASDNHEGYAAHSPTNDLGVITPTAALSSFPYTPEQSLNALKFFYYTLGDKLWGEYGFYDAFNVTQGWYGNSYLAIDQGPIIVMIENHRTGLLWDLFMSCPEVQGGLNNLGFTY